MSSLLLALHLASNKAQASGFSWFQLVPGFEPSNEHNLGVTLGMHEGHEAFMIPTAWAMVAFILLFAVLARMGLEKAKARAGITRFSADAALTPRTLGEIAVGGLFDMVKGPLGEKEAKHFFPIFATFFLYIMVSNFAGFIPGLLPITDNFSSNMALALTSFLVFNYAGFSRLGFGYIKHLMGPVAALAPIFLVLESLSLIIRPISLTIRLTVNIFVDHLLGSVAQTIGSGTMGFIGAVILPIPFYFLGTIVCFVQAFIFSLLSTIYVGLSIAHEEGHGDDGHHDGHHH